MRFMVMHKMTEALEKGVSDPEVMAGVGKLIGEAVQQKVFIGGAGLKPTAQRTQVVYKNGQRTVTDGPFTEAKELVGGFALRPKPENPPLRYLSIMKMVPDDDIPPSEAEIAKTGALIEEMTKAGVLEVTGGLASTKKGARIRFEGGKQRVIDGPFAESKELVAGYSIVELPSKAAAIEWAVRFGKIAKVNEVEVRQMPEW